MQLPRPADELHEIRAEIAKLQAREKALVQAFLRDAMTGILTGTMGRFAKVEVVQDRELVFDAALLPDDLRLNPAYYREVAQTCVQTQPLPSGLSPRPGWPMRREAQTQALH